ncbi:MAG: universal stress protein [Actinomycetales bacterium]|nr:universal stress protein [Actinomycetales bacterium]
MAISISRFIVGWDSSPAATAALDWALDAARSTGAVVQLVHAVLAVPPVPYGEMPLDQGVYDDIANAILALGAQRAHERAPEVPITSERMYRGVSGALLECARAGDVIVIGSRSHGGFAGLLVGSTAVQVATHSDVPVVVLHAPGTREGSYDPAGPILVGIDGTEASADALEFAMVLADQTLRAVQAVHAWTLPPVELVPPNLLTSEQVTAIAADQERVAAEAVAGVRSEFPDVSLSVNSVQGVAADVLLKLSKDASMIVVGSRGRGEFRGTILGSSSNTVLHRAACPVAVVRHHD